MRLGPTCAVLLAGALLACAVPASAQVQTREGIALQNQILELRRDMQALQAQGGGGRSDSGSALRGQPTYVPPASGSDMTAQLLQRVQSLEEQVRQLRGQLDEVTNQTTRQNAEMAKQIGDLSFSLQQGGGRGTASSAAGLAAPGPAALGGSSRPPAQLSPPAGSLGSVPDLSGSSVATSTPATASAATARRTPETALQEGHAALARHDYPAAETSARDVLQNNRTSPRAYDAQYLLAQALTGQRNYSQAAIAFDDTYNRSRTGSHAPDALLGLSSSLAAIGERRAACETLTRLASEFPRQSAEVRDGAAGLRQRTGCR